ncbi:MAG TPA: hypothetical protein VHM65_07975, partial [Candidatus Lustribacter sp.]|nr:hypothetical protein [Candidatus Lustribacter sp.]
MLRQASISVVLDLTALRGPELTAYLRDLPSVIESERAAWGLPHWIVLDEAHSALGPGGAVEGLVRPTDRGYCLVTFRPDELAHDITAEVDVRIATGGPAEPTKDRVATLIERGCAPRTFTIGARRTRHIRHWHKYTSAPLRPEQWFRFRRLDGSTVAAAVNVAEFVHYLRVVDAPV